ncbi:F0F1 ATP synthase subunit delta [Pseudooceanicola nanhaiensis]|uniref:F0F1 ATP synthase subunit delta n=1 Tax=Pseudooceanicola nanhaiensis TaxID=375761 RepID=UPI001CD2B27C|nr:F0F1 ATP synthase subunit delta [Pseudooceanicola nanhaiensis]MCA0920142.1 F0F1 ATP synthase subunit delta [Pseudooceanicola nanhaiensis]
MSIDWWTLGLQAVNVLVLLWILSRFLFRPVSDIIAARQAAATQDLDAAQATRAEAEAALAAAQEQLAGVAATRAQMLAEARSEADRSRDQLLSEARAEVEKLRTAAQADRLHRQQEASHAMHAEAAELAVDIARRLLDRLPATARVAGFIDGLAEAVARLPERTRAGIGAEGPVPLRAAAEMSGDEADHLRERLARVTGHPVALAVTTDPTLIAGLELDAPHAVVRNHFRADLDRIRQELLKND